MLRGEWSENDGKIGLAASNKVPKSGRLEVKSASTIRSRAAFSRSDAIGELDTGNHKQARRETRLSEKASCLANIRQVLLTVSCSVHERRDVVEYGLYERCR